MSRNWAATAGRGWVAVLNDMTELKELDQLKSQMVRDDQPT